MRLAARLGVITGALLCAAVCSALWAGAVGAPRAAEITQLKDGPGRDLTIGRCIICHSVEYIPANAPAMDRASWQKSVQKMRERFGAPITDDEAKQILDYLAANYAEKRSA
jgi:mono/diheme cytochrome c family protein